MVQCITTLLDYLIDTLKCSWRNANLLACLAVSVLSVYPVVCFLILREKVHVTFWLGPLPVLLNLAVPVALYSTLLVVPCLSCTRFRAGCLRATLLTWFVANGSMLAGCGLYVLQASYTVSGELIGACGSGARTARVQAEWQRLRRFQQECQRREGQRDIFIQQCPGFRDMQAAPHEAYVDYIEDMELDYDCQGFCHLARKPLFSAENLGLRRCASAVGEEIADVGYAVGLPLLAIGALVALLGACLAGYDHL
mmetsp:Transcript_105729/g.341033  ORF Transcript_105729/g.341033 Transcript_105729/m.341033 type:complete len:253 (-) Transcript_105729:101-859(-)